MVIKTTLLSNESTACLFMWHVKWCTLNLQITDQQKEAVLKYLLHTVLSSLFRVLLLS